MMDGKSAGRWDALRAGVEAEARADIDRELSQRTAPHGANLFVEGDAAREIVILRSGRVRLHQSRPNGDLFAYRICYPGAVLGLAACVAGNPHVFSAEALEDCETAAIERGALLRLMDAHATFHANVAQLLAQLALEGFRRSAPIALDNASARVSGALLDLLERHPSPRVRAPRLRVSHEELGRLSGLSRNWVGRTLAAFEADGVLEKSRGVLAILDPARLADAAGRTEALPT